MTVLGKHSINETRDLLAVVDYRFKTVGEAFKKEKIRGEPPESPVVISLFQDWVKLRDKYTKDSKLMAAGLTLKRVQTFPVPADLVATEDEWRRILDYVEGHGWDKGSFRDVRDRFEKLYYLITFPNDPRQGSKDVDQAVFKELDTALVAGEKAAAGAGRVAAKAATSNTGLIIGGAVLATVATVVAVKVYL